MIHFSSVATLLLNYEITHFKHLRKMDPSFKIPPISKWISEKSYNSTQKLRKHNSPYKSYAAVDPIQLEDTTYFLIVAQMRLTHEEDEESSSFPQMSIWVKRVWTGRVNAYDFSDG